MFKKLGLLFGILLLSTSAFAYNSAYTGAQIDANLLRASTAVTTNFSGTPSFNSLYIGAASSNTYFNSTGYMTGTNNAMAWDDVGWQKIVSVKDTGAGSLTLTTISGNISGWSFQVNDYVDVSMEMSHRWVQGTPISIHAHAMTKSTNAADRFMKWQLEYCWVYLNGQIGPIYTVSNNLTVPAGTPINTEFYVELAVINTEGQLPSAVSGHLIGRFTRVTATGTAVGSDPIVLSLGVHGRINSLGSTTEYIK